MSHPYLLCYEIGNTNLHSLLGFSDVAVDVIRLVVPDLTALAHRASMCLECPYCVDERVTDGHLYRQLVRSLNTPEAWQAFRQSPGLCTAHVAQVAMLLPEVDARRTVYVARAPQLDAIRQQLDTQVHASYEDTVQARRALRRARAITTGVPVWPILRANERVTLPQLPADTPACPLCRACADMHVAGPLCARHAVRRWLAATQRDEHLSGALRIAREAIERACTALAALQAAPIERITWWCFGRVQRRIADALREPPCVQCAEEERLLRAGDWPLDGAICVPHLHALVTLRSERNEPGIPASIQAYQRQLAYELAEYGRKHDYRYHDEGWGAEYTVVERAWAWQVGAPEVLGGPVPPPAL